MGTRLHIGEIAEILDLYGSGKDGASVEELSKVFKRTPQTIKKVIEKYKNQFKKTGLKEYLES